MKILVAGLQRSGTNFFSELLVQNCETKLEVLSDELRSWKHDFPQNIEIPRNTKLFYIRKKPYNWVHSVSKQPEDLHRRVKSTGSEEGLVLYYKEHSLAWAEFISRRKVFYTEYETLLLNPKLVVKNALQFHGLKPTDVFIRPPKVNLSPDYDPKTHDRMYINSEFEVSKAHSKMIEKYLRWFL